MTVIISPNLKKQSDRIDPMGNIIETKVARITQNKEPITDSLPYHSVSHKVPDNAPTPILSKFLLKVILFNTEQPLKALFPILVTFDISIDDNNISP